MHNCLPASPSLINQELEEIIKSRGGLFTLQGEHASSTVQLFKTIQSIFERYVIYSEKELYKTRPRKISYGILAGTNLNAFAYASSSDEKIPFDFIGINVGTIFTLINVFGRILSHPDNFPEIGDTSLETAERTHIPYLSTDVFTSQQSLCLPNCPIRSIYSSNLAVTALTFLFYHEVTHLRNGHLEYIKEKISYSYWQEAINTGKNQLEPLVQQALEMDADCGAVVKTLNETFTLMNLVKSPRKEVDPIIMSAARHSYGNNKIATKTVLYSTYVLFRLFDFSEWDYFNQHKQSHPQPPIRMHWIGATIYEVFLHRPMYEYDPNIFIQDAAKYVIEAEIACGKIKDEKPDTRGILSVVSTNVKSEYLNKVKDAWKTIRPYLEDYKRGGELAD